MLVRSVLSLSVALLLFAGASPACAEQGLPSQSMLSDLGLSGMAVMSDADAMAIRGFGYQPQYGNRSATAYGGSYASISGYGGKAYSENGYFSSSRYRASGNNDSYAGIRVRHSPRRGRGYGGGGHGRSRPRPHVKKIVVFAGGSSYSSTD